ncbi:MAG TPA: hypothetical protein VGM56_25500 [Byssovorax sp.]|jgi:hypothetical protein
MGATEAHAVTDAEAAANLTEILKVAAVRQRAVGENGAVSFLLLLLGVVLLLVAGGCVIARSADGAAAGALVGLPLTAFGFVGNRRGNRRGERATWLFEHGAQTQARVLTATYTGRTAGSDHAEHRLDVEILGADGPYAASTLHAFPRHEVSEWIDRVVAVRLDPKKPGDFVLDLPLSAQLTRMVEDNMRARQGRR